MNTTYYGQSIGEPGPNGWDNAKISALGLSLWYKKKKGYLWPTTSEEQAVKNVSLPIFPNKVTGIMGPSGCGKSTVLKMFNRLHDLNLKPGGVRREGSVLLDGVDIYRPEQDVNLVRAKIGLVLQDLAVFPMSIYEQVAFSIRLYNDNLSRSELDGRVESYLRRAALWDEVKDRLKDSSTSLSGGQQQRLCIARSIAAEPEVLLMDEPTSKLDVDSAELIEDLIYDLKKNFAIVIVTHSGAQAAFVSDYIAFMYKGLLLEFDDVNVIINTPHTDLALRYVTGRRMNDKKKTS